MDEEEFDEAEDTEESPPQLDTDPDAGTDAPDGQEHLDEFLEKVGPGPLGAEPQTATEIQQPEPGQPLESPQEDDPANIPAPETFVPTVAELPPDIPGEDIGERAIPDPTPPPPADTLLERLMRESHDRAEEGKDDFQDVSAEDFLKMDVVGQDSGGGSQDMANALQGLLGADHELNNSYAELLLDHEQKLNGIIRLLEAMRL